MDLAKRKVHSTDLYLERIRGQVLLEGHEQAYELVCNFNEMSLKPLKQPSAELGVVVYGRNLNEQLIKDVLKCGRT